MPLPDSQQAHTPANTRRLYPLAALLIVLGCMAVIISTYTRLSQTTDESNHIATGLEWLQDGTYLMWTENPPLARVMTALGPYLAGSRLPEPEVDSAEPWMQRTKEGIEMNCGVSYGLGGDVLYENGVENYPRQLALARAGTLPFFILAAVVLWSWLGREDRLAGLLSIAAFCTLPAILAHSALATTDLAFVAMFLLFIWCLVGWLENKTALNAIWLGGSLGLAVATKFTALVFIPAAVLALVTVRIWHEWHTGDFTWKAWGTRALMALLVIAPVAFLTLWAGYHFSTGSLSELPSQLCGWPVYGPHAGGPLGTLANRFTDTPLPMPEFFHGVSALLGHNRAGHWAYALGEVSRTGFWYFYLLALLVKTPLPFMIFVAAGLVAAFRRAKEMPWWVWGIFGATALILLSLTSSQVNIGLRHALAVYALTAVAAAVPLAVGVKNLSASRRRPAALLLGGLFAWQVIAAGAAHPDYLAYFNIIAGKDPGRFLVDSDLDWGQGVYELEEFFSEHEADVLHIAYFGGVRLCEHDLPPLRALRIGRRVTGWVAVSEFFYREAASFIMTDPCGPTNRYVDQPGTNWFAWLHDHEPVAILNRSIRLYYIE